jgi:hypothetical protein
MALGISSANLATPWLNVLRNTSASAIATVFVKLHTGDPGSAGASNAAAGSTTRQSFTFAAPSSNALALSSAPAAWTNGGTTETLSHVSVWDASTSGNFLFSAALASSQAWGSGNQFTLSALGLTLSGIAA